jgi:hypothetical protein
MHGVLRQYTLDAKNVNEVIRRIREGGVPIINHRFVSTRSWTRATAISSPTASTSKPAPRVDQKAAAWVKENMLDVAQTRWRATSGCARSSREVRCDPSLPDRRGVEQIVTAQTLPLVTHLPGFATYSILDAGKGTLVTLSGFTTSSGAAESTKAAATYVKEHLAELVPSAPEVTSGEVKLMERAAAR